MSIQKDDYVTKSTMKHVCALRYLYPGREISIARVVSADLEHKEYFIFEDPEEYGHPKLRDLKLEFKNQRATLHFHENCNAPETRLDVENFLFGKVYIAPSILLDFTVFMEEKAGKKRLHINVQEIGPDGPVHDGHVHP